jgi:hypothetical protein
MRVVREKDQSRMGRWVPRAEECFYVLELAMPDFEINLHPILAMGRWSWFGHA